MIETLIQQYLSPVALWFVGLFTPAEWKAFILLICVTIAGTHTIKVVWRRSHLRGGSHTDVYIISALLGAVSAYFLWPQGFSWWVPAILAGPASALAFKAAFFLIKKLSPDLAATLNLDRRKRDAGPPGGFPRRATDEDEA